MTPPAKANPIHRFFLLASLSACLTYSGAAIGSESVSVPNAFRMHIEQADLQNLARAFGQELARMPVSGTINGPVTGDLGFTSATANQIKFSLQVLSADAEFNGSTGIASHVLANNLRIDIDHLKLNDSGSIFCRNLRIVSENGEIPIFMNLKPVVDNRILYLNPHQVHVDINDSNFRAEKPQYCETPWGFGWLVQQLVPWLTNSLRQQIAGVLATRVTSLIDDQTQQINQYLSARLALPFAVNPQTAAETDVNVWPEAITISANALDLTLGSEIHYGQDQSGTDYESDHLENRQAPIVSWVGISNNFLSSVLKVASEQGALSPTLNSSTVPSMRGHLDARSLNRLIPDACARFRGTEGVEINVGKAASVSVIYNPNGPGGIPIIDMVLQQVPVKVKIASTPYFSTKNTLRFRFSANVDSRTGKLILTFMKTEFSVREFGFDQSLRPRPSNSRFDSDAFATYLQQFIEKPQSHEYQSMGITLPQISLGDYRFDWQGISVTDQYLKVGSTIRSINH